MSQNFNTNLLTLPVDLVYLILDHLKVRDIYCSTWNVCARINSIVATYRRYQVRYFLVTTVCCFQKFESTHINGDYETS